MRKIFNVVTMETNLIYPEAYQTYIDLVKSSGLKKALTTSMKRFYKLAKKLRQRHAGFRYAEDKWSIRQMMQHIIDAERVFVYRALCFSRNDRTELPGFDENLWAENTHNSDRSISELLEELLLVRQSTLAFFNALTAAELDQNGIANGKQINVRALGYVCAGHLVHHQNILQNRYLLAIRQSA